MNNRRSLKENLTISNKQRFSIRKFSIGVASVMLGTTLYFMGGVGPSIVHADSVDQPVQTQTSKDINSAQASSDATLAQQDSDQNQSQVSSVQNDEKTTNDQTAVKSSQQATNASAAKSNTQDSKKAVSDTNETKSVANKAQTSDQLATATSDKSSQQVAKTDTKNSNTLDIKQNKQRLAGNVKLNALTDNKAQTDTQTNSKYSVTDNYPADLTNYLPSTFNNKQEYAFEWLRTQTGNNIILTTNRTGDGVVYVYQDRKKVGRLAQNKSLDLDFGADSYHDEYTGADFYYGEYTGTVYNDNKSGLVQSNPVKVGGFPYPSHYDYNKLTIIYSSHAKDVDDAGSSYSTVSFFVPHKITQTVTYYDSNGKVIDSLTHTQDGLTGQSYTTGLPSGSEYVRLGEYLDNITNNGSGLISEFYDGYSCTKDYHDGVSVTFTEHDSEKTGIGTMDYVIYEKILYDGRVIKKPVQSGSLAYGQSTYYTNYSGRYTIVNPYVPQTTNIVYQYKKLGKVITTDPSGNTTWVYYTNDQNDPTKIEPVNAKPITGYSAIVKYENKIVSDKNFMPTNLGENTYITYTANDQKAKITYIDDTTKTKLDSKDASGKFGQAITFETAPADEIANYKKKGYVLVSNNFDNQTYQAVDSNNVFEVHLVHDTQKVNRQKTVTLTIDYKFENGKTAQPTVTQTKNFSENGTKDLVTGKTTWDEAAPQTFEDVTTPAITGYTPDKSMVKGSTVNFGDSDIVEHVVYSPDKQQMTITYIDDTTGETLHTDTLNDGVSDQDAKYTTSDTIKQYEDKHYKLVSDSTNGKDLIFDHDDTVDQSYEVHLVHDTQKVNRQKTVTLTIDYKFENGKTAQPTVTQTKNFSENGTKDLVTGKTTWDEAAPQTFEDVTTPAITGYTPDKSMVKGSTVNFGDSDIVEHVVYSPDKQQMTITYIDDTTGETLHTDTLNDGVSDQDAKYTTSDTIKQYEDKHYKLVSDSTNGKDLIFDHDDTVDQSYEVHLVHDTQKVNRQKTVTLTIDYKFENGKTAQPTVTQTKNFSENGTKDLVTGKTTWDEAAPQTFEDVTTPAITGYTPDKSMVKGSTVNFGDSDIVEHVVYSPDKQQMTITYIDDTTGETLHTDTLNDGVSDQDAKYTTSDTIKQYEDKHYKLVSDSTNGKDLIFDHDDTVDQSYEVHLVHDTQKVNRQKTVTLTIDYKFENGKTAQPTVTQTKNFSENGTKDLVTGKTTWDEAAPQTFEDVTTPAITGYTPDKSMVKGSTVNFGDSDIVEHVVYSPDKQQMTITYIDDTTGETLHTDTLNDGVSDQDAKYTTSDTIKQYEDKHYKLVSDSTNGKDLIFDHDDTVDQSYEVHLVHDTQKVNRQKTVTLTIDYKFENGKTAQPTVTQTKNFSENGTKDLVTGKTTWDEAAPQTFEDVTTPAITGYTPDKSMVKGSTVNFGDSDIVEHVVYSPDKQQMTITYIDDTTGETLHTDTLNDGVSDQDAKYTTSDTIKQYEDKHYKLVSDSTNGKDLIFDHDDTVDQSYEVHLVHDTQKVNRQKTVTLTIDYKFENGKTAQPTVTQTKNFSENGTKDLVTGKTTWDEAAPQTFEDVTTPAITGYTPDKSMVKGSTVNFGDSDIVEHVVYSPDKQQMTITYIDDTTGETLHTDTLNDGVSDQDAKYTTSDTIKQYEDKHYKLVSDSTNGKDLIFDHDDTVDQSYEVHLVHDTQKVNRQKTVTLTIDYKFENGKTAQPTVTQTKNFSENGTKDLVTGKTTWDEAAPQTFEDVTTPAITGYTPDKSMVKGSTVNFGDSDIVEHVVYSPDKQQMTITYIDDTTGETLHTDTLNDGVSDQDAKYTTSDTIKQYEDKHYKLVSDSTNGKDLIFDHDDTVDQSYEVHLVHDTQKVNRQKTVTLTIDYKFENGKTAQPTVTQTKNFSENGTKDLVTGKTTWDEAAPQTFEDVTTPAITGYTPDKSMVKGSTVNFGDSDIVEHVVYSPDKQQMTITYIDDTTGETLHTDTLNDGVSDQDAKYTTSDTIKQYEDKHYKLVSDSTNGKDLIFDHDDTVDQSYEVHLVHDTQKVNRQKTVTLTIDYKFENGKTAQPTVTQTKNFSENGTKDLVTGKTTWDEAAPQTFEDVTTPAITGYTPDKSMVKGSTVNFGDSDIVEHVVYSPDKQQMTITYIDDTTGETLHTDTLNDGVSDQDAKYTTSDTIKQYEDKHYKLVSDSTNGKDLIFDHDDTVDQSYEVHLVHDTQKVNRQKTVTLTIDYKFENGKTAQPTVTQTKNFSENGTKDLVTGKTTWDEAAPQTFEDVTTPAITGYTPDKSMVKGSTVNFGDSDIVEHVVYSPDKQQMTITYIDDTTGETLHTDTLNDGVSDQDAKYTTSDTIKQYEDKHYKLVSDSTNGKDLIFDHDDTVDQSYEVHLVHDTQKVNRQKTVTLTIDYKFENGKTAQPTVTQTKNFSENGTKDLVTGKTTWDEAAPQTFEDVTTPAITGYTPDKSMVKGSTVNFGDSDIVEHVVYSPDKQQMTITYIDDTTGETLHTDTLNDGVSDQDAKYTTSDTIKQYEDKHYKLVSDSTKGQDLIFDHDDNVDQTYEVHFVHNTHAINQTTSPKQTIHYVYADGSASQGKVADDHVQQLSFKRDGYNDEVTGVDHWNAWTPANSQYETVDSPVIQGYTPNKLSVEKSTVNPTDEDIEVTVTYSPNVQLGHINYIDDSTKKTLTRDDFSGKTNEHEDYTPSDRIQEFENKGYELVSNDYPDGGFNFDANDQQDQVFNVHLKHGTITVTPENPGKPGEPINPGEGSANYPDGTDKTGLTDTVNRTITYVMIDGSKAPDAVHDSLSYTASKVIDKVSGQVLSTTWSRNQDFKDVDSPAVAGYTPDKKTVSNKNVAHDAADITETVKYSADAQKASVAYVDDKTGKTLKVDNLNGVTNAKSGYTTKAAIDTYTGLGYTLVSDDTNGKEVVFDNDDAVDQAFTVHLSHGTITVTPENPGKPGEPVDPDNPDGPKYPDGTDEYQVKRTGTQTIHYVGAGDKTPADNKQTFVFTREITFDDVTGKIISVTPWNVQSHTFGKVDTPVIPGYHADKAVAGGATVTPDDLNKVIIVTYAPDGGSGDNPGSNGGGDQGATPTPDDQPDTTLPSDNNTDKDVEKDKQDKPEEVKKARKIIKTRITKQEHIGNAEKAEPLAEQEHNDQTVASPVKNEANEPQLPQTGEANTSAIGLLGMLVAGFAAILGFESSRSRKHKN